MNPAILLALLCLPVALQDDDPSELVERLFTVETADERASVAGKLRKLRRRALPAIRKKLTHLVRNRIARSDVLKP